MANIAPLPNIAQIQGGLNAVNQAAFANPQQPTSPLSILPTVPTGIPNFRTPIPQPTSPGGAAGGGGQGAGGGGTGPLLGRGGQGQNQNFLNTIRQRLGMQPLQNVSRGTPGGGPGSGTAAAQEAIDKLVGSNIAVSPSAVQSLKMAGMFTGPTGLALGLGNLALGDPLGGLLGQSGFNVPGGQLTADQQQAVRSAYANALAGIANPTAAQINKALAVANATLSTERALAAMGGIKSPGTLAPPGTYSSTMTDQGPMIGANFTSPGFAPGAPAAMGSGGPQGGAGGGPGGGGPDTGGGMGGGVGGVGRST